MIVKLSCLISHHTSRDLSYMVSMREVIFILHKVFRCVHCVPLVYGDDAMKLPQHLTCVREFGEVFRLSMNQGSCRQ